MSQPQHHPNTADIRTVRHVVLDMDGVLWRGNTPSPGLKAFFETLRQLDIGAILATNNASRTVSDYVTRLAGYGVALAPDQVLTSGVATASYLQGQFPLGTRVFVVGEVALHETMGEHGFHVLDPEGALAEIPVAPADIVVAAIHRQVRYHHLAAATLHINLGAAFYATNPDPTVPHELGTLPGAGAILAAITASTDVLPTVIGKPGPIMFQEALRRMGARADTTAMVGDRLGTDIEGGRGAGLQTVLVLSGVTTAAQAAGSALQPDYVFDDIAALGRALVEANRP